MQNISGSLNLITYHRFFYMTPPQLLQEITYLYRKKYFCNVTNVQLKAFPNTTKTWFVGLLF